MKNYIGSFLSASLACVFGIAAVVAAPASVSAEEGPRAEINKPAPDFSLPAASGNTVKLSQFKGKTVILEWINHECPFVKKHYNSGNMQKLQENAANGGIVWLSINSSAPGKQGHLTAEEAKAISAEKKSKAADILLDEKGEVGRAYGAKTTPHMYIVDKEGVLRYMGAIDDTPSTKADDIPNSKNFVTVALNALGSGSQVEPQITEAYGCSIKYAS